MGWRICCALAAGITCWSIWAKFALLTVGPDGQPWLIGLAAAGQVPIADQAVATSAGSGTPFTQDTRTHHLFDPRNGRQPGTGSST